MSDFRSIPRDRIAAGIAVAVIEAGLFYLLLAGYPVPSPQPAAPALDLFTMNQPTPPRPRAVKPVRTRVRPEGAASPPNVTSRQTAIVAPPPAIPLIVPPTIAAAPASGAGSDPSAGNADVRGPGAGRGGQGNGVGSGGAGEGDGDGDETAPRWRSGHLRNSDFPRAAIVNGAEGTVSVRYTVATDGHAIACAITRSSGSTALDATTCRLIEKRLRFYPARDGTGRPVPSIIEEDHSWVIEQDAAPPNPAAEGR